MRDEVTPLVLTRDEEANIGRTLAALAWAREVVVVDSLSTDRTVEIARSFPNVRVLQREIDTIANQWNFGLDAITTPWVLSLDADHVVPASLATELDALRLPDDVAACIARFAYAVDGKTLRGSLYPPREVLLRRSHCRFWQDGHTQRVRCEGATRELSSLIVHDDRKSFRRFLERQRKYMKQEAAKLRSADPVTLNLAARVRRLVVVAPFAVVVHSLFVKGLILDGWPGLRYAFERFVAECMLSRELLR
jgi:glycosyltransferase involved in cell wall biosynthesis